MKEDRQHSFSEEQGNTLITYSAGVSAEGNPQESMITVGVVRGGFVFPAVEAIYSKDGKLDAYLVHNGSDTLEWKTPKENSLRDIDNKFVVKDANSFEAVTLPVRVTDLPIMLDKGEVTSESLREYAVGFVPKVIWSEEKVSRIDPLQKSSTENRLAATGDQ